jgi:hypothetical protein
LIHHGDAFGDAYGMMVGQNRYAKADPDALGSLAQRPEHHLRAWGAGESHEEVVLHEPEIVETHPVGQLALLQGLLIQRIPIDIGALKRSLRLVQEAKLHGLSPNAALPSCGASSHVVLGS